MNGLEVEMERANVHDEALRQFRRLAEQDVSLAQELDLSSAARDMARDMKREQDNGEYRLPYSSRPRFLGTAWK